ncbi:transcriptional regulator, partial [Clostridium saudiense]|nr:transcriptional regulator [Clostridium saudiense]
TETIRKSNVMIIAATTENVESSLLLTFRRRIPMLIEIPPVKDRPLEEKFELINQCFLSESYRIDKDILVSKEVISDLMKYEFKGNIGELKSDIQVACAIGFLENNL